MDSLLLIDPQNDFCDQPRAALPVPGAMADVARMAEFVRANGDSLRRIVVTLDSHPAIAIERPAFWMTGEGGAVGAYTEIVARDVREGRLVPRNRALMDEVIAYLEALESGGKYKLMVWPAHCIDGSWGNAVPDVLAIALRDWGDGCESDLQFVRKGMSPMREQYSAVRAAVPDPRDPRTQTNQRLLESLQVAEGETLYVAGEALSHCVRDTMLDIFETLSSEEVSRIVLLTDCMSPVRGYEAEGAKFLAYARSLGARTQASTLALA